MQQEDKLRLSLVQFDIAWEDKRTNLEFIHSTLKELSGNTDIAVFPEMCTTGFSMNSKALAETNDGETLSLLKKWSEAYQIAVCGSFIADNGDGHFYNRAFFITPDKEFYYDKKHLFRMGSELNYFSAGKSRTVFEHKGFNICLQVCYDLRFPVWSRNVDKEYDLLIYVASWPVSRIKAWDALLPARAIENMCYVCGVNRVGQDGNGLIYNGNSKLINAKGDEISTMKLNFSQTETVYISKSELERFRMKFPVWKDGDKFEII